MINRSYYTLFSALCAFFGFVAGTCSISCGFSCLDRLTAVSVGWTGGVVFGVLRRVFLRCVFVMCLRLRGFVGLVLVVTCTGSLSSPSVASSCLLLRGYMLPFVTMSSARLRFLIALFLVLFFKRCTLSINSSATSLVCLWSDKVGS